jgi:hypothetical protein
VLACHPAWEAPTSNHNRWLDDSPFSPEPFRRDEAWHYTGHCESRVLIDPAWIEFGKPFDSFTRLSLLVNYARKASTPTKIELLFPPHLKPPKARKWEGAFFHGPFYREVPPPKSAISDEVVEALSKARAEYGTCAAAYSANPSAGRPESELDRLIYGGLLFGRPEGLGLLALVVEHHCDYLLTENPWILGAAEPLKKVGIWPADPEGTLELLQLSLRSVGVFVEVVNPFTDEDWGELGRLKVGIEGLGFSHFYHMENRTLQAYQQWFARVIDSARDKNQLGRHGRAAFYHRFPFLLYAHDQLRYHSLYAQRFARDNRYRSDHRFYVAYHLNAFYVMLAALLDNVAWIWNYALELGFKEHVCVLPIMSPYFSKFCHP